MKKTASIIAIFLSALLLFLLCSCDAQNAADIVAEISAEANNLITEIYDYSLDYEQPDDASFEDETYSFSGEKESEYVVYSFANDSLLYNHYEKHGIDMGFDSAEEYVSAANDVINSPYALHKTEAEDGDDVYYLEDTNEFVIVSTYGKIRTYFNPDDGIDYFNRQ